MSAAMDWEALGYKSGQAQAERDGAYFDPTLESMALGPNGEVDFFAGGVVNGLTLEEGQTGTAAWQTRGAEIAPSIILALQPDRPQDAQFQADCQRFAEGFAQGYLEAII